MERDIAQEDDGGFGLDVALAEAEFTRVWARWELAIEELGGTVPASQLRALLIIDESGILPPGRLASRLGLSPSDASGLGDRMAVAGLLRWELAAVTGLEMTLAATAAGHRLAGWIRERRRAVVAHELGPMSPDGRHALVRGLSELAGHQVVPPRDATSPETHT